MIDIQFLSTGQSFPESEAFVIACPVSKSYSIESITSDLTFYLWEKAPKDWHITDPATKEQLKYAVLSASPSWQDEEDELYAYFAVTYKED